MNMSMLYSLSQGNPGAMVFIAELMNAGKHSDIETLKSYGISGTDLYVLHSDLCGKDLDKVSKLISLCPKDVLIDACSRQDYSGRKLVADYLAA